MRSIDECISLFHLRDGNEYSAVRQMESLSEWELAAEYWDKLGKFNDAKACKMIAEAIKEGDKFREQNKQC